MRERRTIATFLPKWFLISPSLIASGAFSLIMVLKFLIPILPSSLRREFRFSQYVSRKSVSLSVTCGRDCFSRDKRKGKRSSRRDETTKGKKDERLSEIKESRRMLSFGRDLRMRKGSLKPRNYSRGRAAPSEREGSDATPPSRVEWSWRSFPGTTCTHLPSLSVVLREPAMRLREPTSTNYLGDTSARSKSKARNGN